MSLSVNAIEGLTPNLIGKTIAIQTMRVDGDTVLPDTFRKYVGVLKSYSLFPKEDRYYLDSGAVVVVYKNKSMHVELYVYEEEEKN